MKPEKPPVEEPQRELFRVELTNMIDMRHGLVKLAKTVDWYRSQA